MRFVWFTRAAAVTVLAMAPPALGAAAQAADGVSTPGVTVTGQNTAWPGAPDGMRLTLTAHSEASTVADPSCRPEDANLLCWGSLVLRVPDFGGMALKGLEVHRVAVDTGGSGDEGDGGHETALASTPGGYPTTAYVNGLSTIVTPGESALPVGAKVQVKMTLVDKGTVQHADTIDVAVYEFVEGHTKPLVYDSGPQIVQQVAIHRTD